MPAGFSRTQSYRTEQSLRSALLCGCWEGAEQLLIDCSFSVLVAVPVHVKLSAIKPDW